MPHGILHHDDDATPLLPLALAGGLAAFAPAQRSAGGAPATARRSHHVPADTVREYRGIYERDSR